MSQVVNFEVVPREEFGKNAAGRARRAGYVPAVVYGGGREPQGVLVDPRLIEGVIHSERGLNTLIHLKIGDRDLKRMVLIREVQRHPVTERVTHADFVRVEMDRKVEVAIPVHVVGIPVGVKSEGGMLELVNRSVLVRCLPGEIPDFVEVDVSELHNNQHISARDVALPAAVELADSPHEVIVTILGKQAEEAKPAAEAEAAAPAAAEPAKPAAKAGGKSEGKKD
ncbi:MAG: 50S ribosomal protein L25 [Acidobacteria bacterium]|jgi:large subunit ribosomal protein L25|nr:50S ribosomal protein L25 [Acidobacteriota bacterium]